MKKILFSMFALAVMTSCSQSEIIAEATPEASVPIAFAPQMGNSVATRADVALPNTVSLGVFAYTGTPAAIYDNISDMRLRYMTGNETGWFLNPADHYYPSDDTAVDFWAYGPKGNTHLTTIGCDAATGPTFGIKLTPQDIGLTAVDLFATQAKVTGKRTTAATPVAFTLKHLLAQVKFKAKTKSPQDAIDYDVKIYDISISAKGEATYVNNAWATFAGTAEVWKPVDADDTQKALTEAEAAVGELVSLIPGQETTIAVKARIYKKNQSTMVTEQVATIVLDGSGAPKEFLASGKSYTYTVTVEPKVSKITFATPKVTDWVPATGDIAIPQP